MGRVIYSMNVSLDGYVAGPKRELDWGIIDEELHEHWNDLAREAGAFLYGRRRYELMASYWPTADAGPSIPRYIAEFARIWRDKPKVVFSKTLEQVEWNSRLIRDSVADEVATLKEQLGGDLDLGGPTIASTFMRLGLIDEFRPVIHPVVLGCGTPFFPAPDDRITLRLVETRRFGSGVVYLRYQRAGERQ